MAKESPLDAKVEKDVKKIVTLFSNVVWLSAIKLGMMRGICG